MQPIDLRDLPIAALTRADPSRREAELVDQLRMSQLQYQLLADTLPTLVWTARPDGHLDFANQRLLDYIGWSPAALMGAGWHEALHPRDLDRARGRWKRCLDNAEGYEVQVRLRRADGEYRWHLVRALPQLDEAGHVVKWFGTSADIEDQRRAEAAEHRARAEAEAASQAKSDLLAVISHELRTPLNAIMGYVDLLLMGVPEPIGDNATEHVRRIRTGSQHLLQLIEQILSFSRMEAGREQIRPERTELGELIRDAAEYVEPLAVGKGLTFHVSIPEDPVLIETDPAKVRQILLNLLSNAVKFTGEGEVALAATLRGGRVSFRVRDTGTGIEPDKLEQIFEPFRQADDARTGATGGTGLGLSVSRELARLLGGDVTVESTRGRGSTFTVELPTRTDA